MPELEILTVELVKTEVEQIGAIDDDEIAHGAEDALHQRVLAAIAEDRCENPKACAAEALKTNQFNFCRWCA